MNTDLQYFINGLKALTEDPSVTSVSSEDIRARFSGTTLSARQLLLISNYLISSGVDVTDYDALKELADHESVQASPVQTASPAEKEIASWMQPYIDIMQTSQTFDPEEEKRLLAQASQGDQNASQMLLGSYMKMLLDIVSEIPVSDESMRADLLPEAIVYLMQEIRDYKPDSDISFAEKAEEQIRMKLNAYIRENETYDRISAELMDKLARARDAYRRLSQILEREPTDEEIAREIGISVQRLQELQSALPQGSSLYSDFMEGLEGFSSEDDLPEEYVLTEQIIKSISALPPIEQECFIAYYGLDGSAPQKTADIALKYGITDDMVRQCIAHALEQMRAAGIETDFFEV